MHDPNLQAARYAFSAGQESAKQGSALYLPQVTATAMTNYVDVHSVSTLNTRLPLSPLVGNASGTLYGFSVTLTQPIYNIAVSSGDRKSVGEGKSVSVRVDHGGPRTIKKQKKNNK